MFSLLKFTVPVCLILTPVAASAGDPHLLPAGAAQSGMAYVCVMKTDPWSAFHNPAALSFARCIMAGTAYENRFGLRELSTYTLAAIIPSSHATIGILGSRFGYHDFSRGQASLSCGLSLSKSLSAGIQADLYSERTYGDYRRFSTVTFEAGVIARLNDRVTAGIHLFNPLPSALRKRDMISSLTAGAGLNAGKGLFTGAEFEITTGGGKDLRLGMEYELSESVWLRCGFRTSHTSFCFGFGYRLRPLIIDLSFSAHDRLGITSAITLTWIFRKN